MPTQVRIVWAGIVVSTFMYALVIWSVTHAFVNSQTFFQGLQQPVTIGCLLLSITMYALSYVVRRMMRPSSMVRAAIVQWALLESICIYGLVVAFLSHDWRLYLPFWALSMIGFISTRPRRPVQPLL